MIWRWLLGERRSVLAALARRPPMPIANVHDGYRAAIAGTVAPAGELLVAPLSSRPCVYWRLDIEEVGVHDFRVCARDEVATPFLVRDESGAARVIADRAQVALAPSDTRHGLRDGVLARLFREMNARFNYVTSTVRFREYTIAPSVRVHLSGHATREPDPEAPVSERGYRGDLPSRPVFARGRFSPLWIAA